MGTHGNVRGVCGLRVALGVAGGVVTGLQVVRRGPNTSSPVLPRLFDARPTALLVLGVAIDALAARNYEVFGSGPPQLCCGGNPASAVSHARSGLQRAEEKECDELLARAHVGDKVAKNGKADKDDKGSWYPTPKQGNQMSIDPLGVICV